MSKPKRKKKSKRNRVVYLVVSLLCALPFVATAAYLANFSKEIDTLPLDSYSDLRWLPGGKGLAYLHRSLDQDSVGETEIWRVNSTASGFRQVGNLSADFDWSLTKMNQGDWLLLEGANKEGKRQMVLADGEGRVSTLKLDDGWEQIRSDSEGLFFGKVEASIPFDEFVQLDNTEPEPVDENPEEVEDWWSPEQEEELPEEPENFFGPVLDESEDPTRSGLKISEFDPETESLETLLSIPYTRFTERPTVELASKSPDGRFTALLVEFGKSRPGLFVFDKSENRLIWTGMTLPGPAFGLDWSSDSVQIAITHIKGLSLLENVLNLGTKHFALSGAQRLRPRWGAGHNLYLYSEAGVHRFDQESQRLDPVRDGQAFSDLVLDPDGRRLAFSDGTTAIRELVVDDLGSGQNVARASYPGSARAEARATIGYQVGNAIRHAWSQWTPGF